MSDPAAASIFPDRDEDGTGAGAAAGEAYPEDLPELLLRPIAGDHEMRHVFRNDLTERLEGTARLGGVAGKRHWLTPDAAAAWLRGQRMVKDRRAAALTEEELRAGVAETQRPAARLRPVVLWLACLALGVVLAGLGVTAYELMPAFGQDRGAPEWVQREAQRQLYGSPRAIDMERFELDQRDAEQRWREQPDSALHYARYIFSLLGNRESLPADYDETWQRLDPDNALWLLLKAESLARTSSTKDMLDCVEESAKKPRLQSYRQEILADLLRDFREPQTAMQLIISDEYRSMSGYNFMWGLRFDMLERKLSGILSPTGAQIQVKRQIGELRAGMYPPLDSVRQEAVMHCGLTLCWRANLLLGAMLLLGLSGILVLRLLPLRGAPGRMARCVAQVLRPWRCVPVTIGAALLAAGVGAWALTFAEVKREESILTLGTTALGIVLVLAVAAISARREVRRRIGFLGLESRTRAQGILGGLALAGVVLAMAAAPVATSLGRLVSTGVLSSRLRLNDDDIMIIAATMGGLGAMVLVWLAISTLVGYVSATANVRHRLVALQMLPALLAAAVTLGVLALATQPVEREIVRHAWQVTMKGAK